MKKSKASAVDASRIQSFRRPLMWIALVSLIAGATALTLNVIDESVRSPLNKRVAVYFVHGCPCVANWVSGLREAGYDIELFEPESLRPIRQSLGTPPGLHGCHVGQYLDYFLEGHIPPGDLRRLAMEKPVAIGLASSDLGSDDKSEGIQVVHADGHFEPWLLKRGEP